MAKTDEKHTGASGYTKPHVDTVPDHVDTTYGDDQSAVSTDDSETVGAQAVADGDVQSTSGKGGTTSQATNPTPKLVDTPDHDPLSGAPMTGPVEDAPEKPAPVAKAVGTRFVVLTRTDGTHFAVSAWEVHEISENADGTVTVMLPGRDLVTGPGQTNPQPSGPVRVTVCGPFDEVLAAFSQADD